MNLTLLEVIQSSLATAPVAETQTGSVQQPATPAGVFAAMLKEQQSLLQGVSPEAVTVEESGTNVPLAPETAITGQAEIVPDNVPGTFPGQEQAHNDAASAIVAIVLAMPATVPLDPLTTATTMPPGAPGQHSLVAEPESTATVVDAPQTSFPVARSDAGNSLPASRSAYRQETSDAVMARSTVELVATSEPAEGSADPVPAEVAVPGPFSRVVYSETPSGMAPVSVQVADAGINAASQSRYRVLADGRDPMGLIPRPQGTDAPVALERVATTSQPVDAPELMSTKIEGQLAPVIVDAHTAGASPLAQPDLSGSEPGTTASPGRLVLDGAIPKITPAKAAEIAGVASGDVPESVPVRIVEPTRPEFPTIAPILAEKTRIPSENSVGIPADSMQIVASGEAGKASVTPDFTPVEEVMPESFRLDRARENGNVPHDPGVRIDIQSLKSPERAIGPATFRGVDAPVVDPSIEFEVLTGDEATSAAPVNIGVSSDSPTDAAIAVHSTGASAGTVGKLASTSFQPRDAKDHPEIESPVVSGPVTAAPDEATPGNDEDGERREFTAEPARAVLQRARTAYEAHERAPFAIESAAEIAPVVANAQETVPQGTAVHSGIQTPKGLVDLPAVPAHVVLEEPVLIEALPQATLQGVRSLVGHSDGRITIRLHPESLGQLDVTVRTVNNSIEIELSSVHHGVREALEGGMPALREVLAREGIDVARVSVGHGSSLQLSQDGGAAGGRPAAQHGFTPRSGGFDAPGFSDREPDGSGRNPSRRPMNHRGTLNVFA